MAAPHKIEWYKTPYLTSRIPSERLNFLDSKCRESLIQNPGNVIEVGVYKGGSLVRLAMAVRDICPQFRVIAIDTFQGHLYDDGHPNHFVGKYNDVDFSHLQNRLEDEDLGSYVQLISEKVENVLPHPSISNISFAHVDCDLFTPVYHTAIHIPLIMNKGGVIYFEDYGASNCPGATLAVEKVFSEDRINRVSLPHEIESWSCFIQL